MALPNKPIPLCGIKFDNLLPHEPGMSRLAVLSAALVSDILQTVTDAF